MANIDFDKMTRRFILGESRTPPSILSYVQSLSEILNRLRPKTLREKRDLEIAKDQLFEIKKHGRKLMEQVSILEEKLSVLEENKEGEE